MACSFTAGVVIRQFCPESCAVCGTASQPDDQRNGANEEPAPIIEQGQANQAFAVAVGICVALALVAVAAAIARAAAKNKADLSIYTVGYNQICQGSWATFRPCASRARKRCV